MDFDQLFKGLSSGFNQLKKILTGYNQPLERFYPILFSQSFDSLSHLAFHWKKLHSSVYDAATKDLDVVVDQKKKEDLGVKLDKTGDKKINGRRPLCTSG